MIKLRIGERLQLESLVDGVVATLEITRLVDERSIHATCVLASDKSDTRTHHLLVDLGVACHELSFAVMEHVEDELASSGVCLSNDGRRLVLGRDFEAMVVDLRAHHISFRLRGPVDAPASR